MSQLEFDATLRITVEVVDAKAANQQEENRNRGGDNDDSDGQGSKRGFAAMDPEKRREIARKGGESSHGGGRGRGSDSASDEQLEAMESLLSSRKDLPEEGKREIKQAIEKRQEEISSSH